MSCDRPPVASNKLGGKTIAGIRELNVARAAMPPTCVRSSRQKPQNRHVNDINLKKIGTIGRWRVN